MPLDSKGMYERIKNALGASNPSEIARKLKITPQSVYLWQKGNLPAIETLDLISGVSNTSMHWLLTGEGPEKIGQVNKTLDAGITRHANEGQPKSEAENQEELQALLKQYFAHQQLIAFYDSASPRVRAEILALAKGFAHPESIPKARAVDSGTKLRKKAS